MSLADVPMKCPVCLVWTRTGEFKSTADPQLTERVCPKCGYVIEKIKPGVMSRAINYIDFLLHDYTYPDNVFNKFEVIK